MSSWNLISITSNSHSDSTLLDMMIRSRFQCLALGEIHKLIPKFQGVWTCEAQNYLECPFWNDVSRWLVYKGARALPNLRLRITDGAEFHEMNDVLASVL